MESPEELLSLEKTEEGKFIVKIDASLIKESSCERRLWYMLCRGLRKRNSNHKMEYGTAVHKALESFYSDGEKEKAVNTAIDHYADILVPDKDFRDLAHLVNLLNQYFQQDTGLEVRKDPDPLLEMRFAYPYKQTEDLDILFCGTLDFVGTYFGRPVIVDHKSTAAYSPAAYFASYKVSPQLMFYNLIWNKLFPEEAVGCMINGLFLGRSNKNKFERSEIYEFSRDRLEKFKAYIDDMVNRLIVRLRTLKSRDKWAEDLEAEEVFLSNFSCCETRFGLCAFAPLCTANSANDRESIVNMDYINKIYDPLQFQL
tara:strand:+ start:96 stop:1034 length:939 start_codon:yes stop_codon:yes gene_type:complete